MKRPLVLLLAGFALTWATSTPTHAENAGGTNSFNPESMYVTPADVTTRSGAIYKAVRLLKVEPDGLSIQYVPKEGGIGLAKLKFENLPDVFQQHFGYDVHKSAMFEVEQAQGIAEWRAQLLARSTAPRHDVSELQESNEDETTLLKAEKTLVLQTRAKAGDASAKRELAEWYSQVYTASGTAEDRKQAVEALQPLAEADDEAAQLALGNLLTTGDQQDVQAGIKWLHQAAEKGSVVAQRTLGNLYKNGGAVARNTTEAFTWYEIAARGGDAGAIEARDELAGRMSAHDLAEARRRADEFKPAESARADAPSNFLAGQ